jgi:hypothetical protein
VEKELVAGVEVLNGNTHDAIKVLVNVVDGGVQLLPKNFLLLICQRRER